VVLDGIYKDKIANAKDPAEKKRLINERKEKKETY
jgi:hypothetical protein